MEKVYQSLTNFVSKRQKQLLYLELIQYLIFAGIYLAAMVKPSMFSSEFIVSLQILIMFEFIMMHSGVFMSMGKSAVILFFPFYFLFAFAFNLIMPDNTIMYVYLFTILNRFLTGQNDSKRKNDHPTIRALFRCFATYFPTFIGSMALSSIIPEFGLTPDVQKQIIEDVAINQKGDITLKMMISCGVLYYLALIYWEFYFSRRNKESVNILYISSNEIGSIVKSRMSTFSDYVYETNDIENFDLENFDASYSFVVKKEKPSERSITNNLELIIITENPEYVKPLEEYLVDNQLSHIPILDLSPAIIPIYKEVITAYKQRVPLHFQEIPNNHHPIKRSIKWNIFNEIIGPEIKRLKSKDPVISSFDPELRDRLIRKFELINIL